MMPKNTTNNKPYDTPFAEEANKGWKHLVEYCMDQYESSKNSKYRKKKLDDIRKAVEVYNQDEKAIDELWEGECFHQDVEILTSVGWKFVKDVGVGESVATRSTVDGVISYEPVTKCIAYDTPEEGLVRIKNLFYDISVTGNHKFPVERDVHGVRKHKFVTADEIKTGLTDDQRWRLPLSGVWNSEPALTLFGCEPCDFLEFVGWYISEGWLFKSSMIGISQSITANPSKCRRIAALLDRLGFYYEYKERAFLIKLDQPIFEHLKNIGSKSSEKRIPRMYLELPPEQLRSLFESLIEGDGNTTWPKDHHRNFPKTSYYTNSKELADNFQELCLKLGYSGCITNKAPGPGGKINGRRVIGRKIGYQVSVRFTKFSTFKRNCGTIEHFPYNGKVYCVSVPPFNTIYVRQNGKPLWSGNSNYTIPLTTITLDNLEPRLVAGLVGKLPYIRFEMENDQQKDETTEIVEKWYNQELEDVVGIEEMSRSIIHRIIQEGTVYPLPSYDVEERVRIDFVFEDDMEEMVKDEPERAAIVADKIENREYMFENGILMDIQKAEPVTMDVKETLFEGGRYDLIPFHDVFIADDVDNWEKACVIRKVRPTYAELVRDDKTKIGYRNIGPWLYDQKSEGKLDTDSTSASQQYEGIREHGKETIECIECSISYIYNEDDAEEKDQTNFDEERLIAQIAIDSGVLIRLVPLRKINHKNQHLLKRMRLFPENGKSYGTSMADKLKSIQKGAKKTFNTAINIAELTMIPWFLYNESEVGLKSRFKDGLSLKPGMGIPVNDVRGLYFPRFAINPDQMINWINLWVSFWERVSSIGDLQIGLQSKKNVTATETLTVVQEGNIKHNYQSSSVRQDFLDVLRTIYDLYYQNMPFDKTFFWKDNYVSIPRSQMRRMKKFKLTGSTEMSNKLIKRRENEDFYNLTTNDPNINPVKRSEALVKSYGHDDVAEWVNPNVKIIVDKIMMLPGADQAVGQLLQDMEMQLAQDQKAAEVMET